MAPRAIKFPEYAAFSWLLCAGGDRWRRQAEVGRPEVAEVGGQAGGGKVVVSMGAQIEPVLVVPRSRFGGVGDRRGFFPTGLDGHELRPTASRRIICTPPNA